MSELLKILLVDDDDVDRMAVRRALQATEPKCEIEEVRDGRAAVGILKERSFDCVLLDYILPDRDGLAVLREVRQAGMGTPIIMLTGQGDEELAVEMMKAGASDYLVKSRISMDSLAQSVRNAVRIHRAEDLAEQSRHRLLESEHRFRLMADTAPVLLWLANPEGEATYFNQSWLEFTGRSLEQELGDGWIEGVHPEDRARLMQKWTAQLRSQRAVEAEYRLRRYDGEYRWVFVRGMPRFLPDRTFAGFIGSCLDITDRKQSEIALKQSNDRLKLLSETASDLLLNQRPQDIIASLFKRLSSHLELEVYLNYLVDEDDRCLCLDSSAGIAPETVRRIRHLQYGEAICGTVAKEQRRIVAENLAESTDPRAGLAKSLGVKAYACHPLLAHGRLIGTLSFGSRSRPRFEEDELSLMQTVCHQVAMAIDRARLISELKSRATEMKQAKEAAESANRAKDQFLAVLSHELRTPLAPVLTTVTALQADSVLPKEIDTGLEMIRRNVELEARLIDDLLDLTRISKGKLQLNLETVDAHASIRNALEICRSEMHGKKVRLDLDLAARRHHVRADSARLQQVFWNLIKNAVKFTPEGGLVTVRSLNRDGRLSVQVKDTGIGIAPHVLLRIFDAFEQGDGSVTRHFGGLGLGLAITRAVVAMLGGELMATSAGKGKGSTFTIELGTVEPAPEHAAEGPSAPPAPSRKPVRILMVDDHEDTSRAMKRLLERMGYQVATAGSVESALNAVNREPFDLLISDIGLPDGSGLDLMRHLKCGRPIKGIALSGFGMEEDIRKSKEAGFAEHLTKPINFHRLQSVLEQLTT